MGENCLAAMKFKISVFTAPGAGLQYTFLLKWGPGPPQIFLRGGGGFQHRGAYLGPISILKIIIFLMIFLSFGIFILCCNVVES